MSTDPHSIAAELFHHHLTPQFEFTPGEQELLEVALEGIDDSTASKTLFVSLPAIKHRWENIFERVTGTRPDLCPPNGDGKRGIQKRQRTSPTSAITLNSYAPSTSTTASPPPANP